MKRWEEGEKKEKKSVKKVNAPVDEGLSGEVLLELSKVGHFRYSV